ncbi:DUF4267 domain containing [Lecanosticta acicola]|uniref:DUF4267 domain containing n=1 Tax=Lecanosticta acicola TaxID=111012 RepID=A0AAI8Z0Q0_9PEZI|nr:DUF4267 domain containing [Lecanosticta acicola]
MATLSLRSHFAHLPPPAECLAILLGSAELLLFGLGGLTDPKAFAAGYGLPITSSSPTPEPQPQPPASDPEPLPPPQPKALIRALCARNLQNGALLLTFALYTRDRRSLGFAVLLGLITTVADTVIVWKSGVRDLVVGHAVGVVNCLAVGGGLLLWGRGDAWW